MISVMVLIVSICIAGLCFKGFRKWIWPDSPKRVISIVLMLPATGWLLYHGVLQFIPTIHIVIEHFIKAWKGYMIGGIVVAFIAGFIILFNPLDDM